MTREARAATFGWIISLAAHAGILGYIVWRTATPDLGLDFQLPDEVEFGLTDAVTVTAGAPPPPAPAPPPQGAAGPGEGESGADAGVRDAGVEQPDAGPTQPDAGPLLASAEEVGEGAEGEEHGVAFLPAGAQIALRLDVGRIRRSPIGPDVREVLSSIPDWRALLDGSGIDPLEDLDRVLIATPNLDRERIIASGRATGGETAIRAAAQRLATARGEVLTWRTVRGVPVADWHDLDPTERVIALIGPSHFVIARPVDLPRVIAVARARAAPQPAPEPQEPEDPPAEGEGETPPVEAPEHPADALLSMEEGEGLTLEVEGARNFANARTIPIERVPTRLRAAFLEAPDGMVSVRTVWTYDDEEQATAGAQFWDRAREVTANRPELRLFGVSQLLENTTITTDGELFRANVDINLRQMRMLLGFVQLYFSLPPEQRRAMRQGGGMIPRPAPSPAPSPPPTPSPGE